MSFNNDNNNRFTDETDRRQGDALLGSADRLTSDTNKNSTDCVPGVCLRGARSHQTEPGDSGCSGAQEQQRAGLENRDVLDNTADTSKPRVVDKVRGNLEQTAGKVTHNPDWQQRGRERKTGQF